jgi:hypothetical protein
MKTPTIIALLIFVLAACGLVPTEQPIIPTATNAPTFTAIPQIPTASPTETPSLTPMPTPLPLSPLEGLRMAYIADGNLYVQDSGEQPVQLTDSGKDHTPIFSDDGKKIVFLRGDLPYEMYSINVDGSQEQALVSSSKLIALGLGYDAFTEPQTLAFMPGTHQLLFNTHQLNPLYIETKSLEYQSAKPNEDILFLDTDSTEIKELLDPGQGGLFHISPNGKLVAIQTRDHVKVIEQDGTVFYPNLTTYPTSWLYLSDLDIYWTQDSNKLNVVLPIATGSALDNSGPEPRTIWQFPMNNKSAIGTSFSPPPMSYYFSISPDGNWVVYNFTDAAKKTNEVAASGIYIGNLRDGDSKLINSEKINDLPYSFVWNPGSTFFIFWDGQDHLFLSDINGEITQNAAGLFLGWIDDSRYVFLSGGVVMGEIGKEENVRVIQLPSGIIPNDFTFVFLAPKADQ